MRKFFIFALTSLVALTVSCNKDITPEQDSNQDNSVSIVKSFKVVMPETKAYLGDNESTGKKLVKFSDGDEIAIFANTSGNCYTGVFSADSEQFITEITDEADVDESVFFAVYPNSYVATDNKTYTNNKAWKFKQTEGVYIEAQKVLNNSIAATLEGIDPALTVLTAKTNENGELSFVYGCGFLKIKVANENIASISFTTSSERIAGRPQYNEDGDIVTVQSGLQTVTLTASNSLVKNGIYYVPFIPRNLDSKGSVQKIGQFSLTFNNIEGKTATIETSALQNQTFVAGIIYNLGEPSVSFAPLISLEENNITLENDVTSGTINYVLSNAEDGAVVTAFIDEDFNPGDDYDAFDSIEIPSSAITSTTVPFTCSSNLTGQKPRRARIVLSYAGAQSVEVIITQKKGGESENYVWDFSSQDWTTAFKNASQEENVNVQMNITINGLSYTSSSSKWRIRNNMYYIQTSAAGSTDDHCFSFSVNNAGTLTITASNTGGSNPARSVYVKVGDADPQISDGITGTNAVDKAFTISAGDVIVYPGDNPLCFYKIEFHSN